VVEQVGRIYADPRDKTCQDLSRHKSVSAK
jgi:hypothetical protein